MNDNLNVVVTEEDGRWEDQEWLEHQAELSACEDRIERKSCEVVRINGVLCHESGCTDSWQDEVRECKWCGSEFKPEDKFHDFCCDDCLNAYY